MQKFNVDLLRMADWIYLRSRKDCTGLQIIKLSSTSMRNCSQRTLHTYISGEDFLVQIVLFAIGTNSGSLFQNNSENYLQYFLF